MGTSPTKSTIINTHTVQFLFNVQLLVSESSYKLLFKIVFQALLVKSVQICFSSIASKATNCNPQMIG